MKQVVRMPSRNFTLVQVLNPCLSSRNPCRAASVNPTEGPAGRAAEPKRAALDARHYLEIRT